MNNWRLRGVNEDTGVLSEDLPKLEKAFERIGLTLRKDATTFKSTYDIMKDLAGVWGQLTDIQRADMLSKVAGQRQGNVIAGILNNFNDAQSVLTTALNATGSAANEQAKYMESLQYKTAQFQNAILGFWQHTIDSKSVGLMITLGTSLISVLTVISEHVGILPILFGALTLAFTLNGGSIIKVVTNMWAWITSTIAAQLAGKTFSGVLASMLVSLETFGTALITTMAPMLAITAAVWLLQKAWTAYSDAQKADQDRAKKLQEERDQIDKNITSVTKLTTELEKLQQVNNPSTDQRSKMVDLQKQIIDILPQTIKGYTDEGVAIASSTREIRAQIDELKRLRAEKAGQAADLATPDLQVQGKAIEDAKASIAQKIAERDFTLSLIPAIEAMKAQNNNPSLNRSLDETIAEHRKQAAQLSAAIEVDAATIKAAQAKFSDVFTSQAISTTKLLPGDSEWEKFATAYAANYTKAMAEAGKLTQQSAITVAKDLTDQLTAAMNAHKSGTLKLDLVDKDAIAQARVALLGLGLNVQAVDGLLSGLNDTQVKGSAYTYSAISATNELLAVYKDTAHELDQLASAYVMLERGQKLSLVEIENLIKTNPQLIESLRNEHGQLTFTKEAIKAVMEARSADLKLVAQQAIEEAKANKLRLESELDLALKTIGLIKSVNEARKAGITGLSADFYAQNPTLNPDTANSGYAMHAGAVIGNKFGPLLQVLDDADAKMAGLIQSANAISSADLVGSAIEQVREKGNKKTKQADAFEPNRFEHEGLQVQRDLAAVDAELQRLDKTDAKYNEVLNRKIELMTRQRNLAHEEADYIRNVRIPAIEAEIAVQTDYNEIQRLKKEKDDLQKKTVSLSQTWFATNSQIDAIKLGQPVNELDKAIVKYEQDVRALDASLAIVQNRQIGMNTASQEYRDNVAEQNKVIGDKVSQGFKFVDQLKEEQKAIQKRLDTEEMSAEVRKILEDRLKVIRDRTAQISGELLTLNGTLRQNNQAIVDSEKEHATKAEDIANKAIDLYRKIAEQRKNIELDAISKLEVAEDLRHKKAIDALDQELAAFDRLVNAKLKEIDRTNAAQDFDRTLRKATTDRDKIQSQINLLAMDDSPEAKAKRKDLEAQLLAANDNIEQLKLTRSRDLRKQGLQDQLTDFNNAKNAEKKSEDANNKAAIDGYKKQKDEITALYEKAINNEELFSKFRKAAMTGDMKFINDQLGTYFTEFEKLADKKMKGVGGKLKEQVSLANELQKLLKENAEWAKVTPPSPNNGGGSNGGNGGSGNGGSNGNGGTSSKTVDYQGKSYDAKSAEAVYIQNKAAWWEIQHATGQMDSQRQVQLKEMNDFFRKEFGFQDYDLDWLRRHGYVAFDTGGYTGEWGGSGGKLGILHEKEQIFKADDTQRLLAVMEMSRNFMPILKSIPAMPIGPVHDTIYPIGDIKIYVDKLHGTEKDAEFLANALMSKVNSRLKKLGQKI